MTVLLLFTKIYYNNYFVLVSVSACQGNSWLSRYRGL